MLSLDANTYLHHFPTHRRPGILSTWIFLWTITLAWYNCCPNICFDFQHQMHVQIAIANQNSIHDYLSRLFAVAYLPKNRRNLFWKKNKIFFQKNRKYLPKQFLVERYLSQIWPSQWYGSLFAHGSNLNTDNYRATKAMDILIDHFFRYFFLHFLHQLS